MSKKEKCVRTLTIRQNSGFENHYRTDLKNNIPVRESKRKMTVKWKTFKTVDELNGKPKKIRPDLHAFKKIDQCMH